MTSDTKICPSNHICKHYGATFNEELGYRRPSCSEGVNLREHVGGPVFGWMLRLPCLTTPRSREQVSCDRCDPETVKEHYEEFDIL